MGLNKGSELHDINQGALRTYVTLVIHMGPVSASKQDISKKPCEEFRCIHH